MSARFDQALALQNAGQVDAAIACYQEALREEPGSARIRFALAIAYITQHKPDEAARTLAGLPIVPQAADAYYHLAMAFFHARRNSNAKDWFEKALAARPEFATAEFGLGLALQNLGRLEEATVCYRKALRRDPRQVASYQNLALLKQMLGRHDEAVAVYHEGATACPEDGDLPRYAVAAMFYDPTLSDRARFEAAREFGRRLDGNASGRHAPVRPRAPEKRLRIGYLTSDFRDHPIGRNVEPLISHRDRTGFEAFVYADIAEPDSTTARIRTAADSWRDIAGLDDRTVAGLIREDGVDILVCLAGHFDRNRPGVCAYRPAPLQVSFHDVTTSGSAVFDYLIGDRIVCPRPPAEGFTERLFRLPGIYVHAPIDAPSPAPRPAGTPVTFGCLNNPMKLNGTLLAMWARILAAVPDSRLVLKYRNWFRSPDLRASIMPAFEAAGVARERIDFIDAEDDRVSHLRRYEAIDIALDPYPFGGSTATFEALWMGLPVVTLAGTTMMSRWSSSMLHALKLDGLIARSPDHYVSLARQVADDAGFRRNLRADLRGLILRSPLCNGPLRARQIERAYRSMWHRWCKAAVP